MNVKVPKFLTDSVKTINESDVVDRKGRDRKRNILYLINQFLKEEGYLESADCLEEEAQLSAQYSICDNIDLTSVLQDYESYYYLRYQKHPKICKLQEKSGKNEQPKDSRYAKSKASLQRRKKSTTALDSKLEDISDLMNIQSLQKGESPDPPPSFKEGAAHFFSPELQELAENISREIVTGNIDVKWEDVIGLQKAKQALQETLVLPLQFPGLFQGILSPWKSVLLYGPPGTGKTMMAKALANDSKMTFFNITATSVVSKWRGESEKLIRVLFETAKQKAPSVIFMDEFEALACRSSDDHEGSKRLRAEFLMQMDGLISSSSESVFLLAVTNSPWVLQSSILRRFEKRIHVDLPNVEEREEIIRQLLPQSGHSQFDFLVDYSKIAKLAKGYSGSDLRVVCREASMGVLRQSLGQIDGCKIKNWKPKKLEVTTSDVECALKKVRPTASSTQNKYYEWEKNHGSN